MLSRISRKQTIDLTSPNPASQANYSLSHYDQSGYNQPFQCWSINGVQGFINFTLNLPKKQGVNLMFQLCSSTYLGNSNCPINITVNGQLLVSGFDPKIYGFYDMLWSVSPEMLNAGNNEITLTLARGASTKVFVRYATVDIYPKHKPRRSWMANFHDSTQIGDINIPGTHDSAAITTTLGTPYACHDLSITEQLKYGIRLLDIRLKVAKDDNSDINFVTCHGKIGSKIGLNEFQTFPSLLDECKNFLKRNLTEVIIMSIKIDDWSSYKEGDDAVIIALKNLLSSYPTTSSREKTGQARKSPFDEEHKMVALGNYLKVPDRPYFLLLSTFFLIWASSNSSRCLLASSRVLNLKIPLG
jgi:hypothetical protein